MRHLLLIEAASHARPNTRPLLREARKRVRRLMSFEADKPEAWRVSFRSFAPVTRGPRQPRPPTPQRPRLSREERWCAEYWPKPKFYSAWPLAERAEALLRAFNTPEPYAKRLARRLHATPHRAAELTRHPSALLQTIPESDFVQLRDEAHEARRRVDDG